MFNIEEELKKLPKSPGVYIMHSADNSIIYVGKAVNLHNRVRQYFQAGHGHNNSPKIVKMVSQISYFEYIITDSEMEALVLECNLIKEHRPKYNTLMTDDKGYPYIKVTVYEDYPRILYSHQMKRDKSKYFGPYTNAKAVHDTIELLRKLYKIRSCSKVLPRDIGKERPCLYHQINQCDAPCNGLISREEYMKNINDAISFLNGNYKDILNRLNNQMHEHAQNLEFEKAAETRDLIESVKHIADKQMMSSQDAEDKDIIASASNEKDTVVSVFFIRDGKLLGREHHHMNADKSDKPDEILSSFIKQYYSGTPYLPKEILTDIITSDHDVLEQYLSDRKGTKVHIYVPQKGDKKRLLLLAKENAELVLKQDMERIKRQEKRTTGAVNEIAEILGIPSASRMEAFDISNISGFHSVASMVVFENGKPKKNSYRKFKLKTVSGPDDYASMKEVLSRRFTDEKLNILPDVIMMDGGKGQVNIAEAVLNSLGLEIPVCGMVKDDHHRTRGLYYNNKEVMFPKGSEAILMVTALQDEAHRFAIEYHKLLRQNNQVRSILDDIKGVGPARRKALMKHFKDIDAIKSAGIDELKEVPGLTEDTAKSVYDFFH